MFLYALGTVFTLGVHFEQLLVDLEERVAPFELGEQFSSVLFQSLKNSVNFKDHISKTAKNGFIDVVKKLIILSKT